MTSTDKEVILSGGIRVRAMPGSAGLRSQVYGQPVTVSAVASATGGIVKGNLIRVSNIK